MMTCRRKVPTSKLMTYQAIAEDYIHNHRDGASRVLKFYALQRGLKDAIAKAAFALLPSGKRHPHQYRIRRAVLVEVQVRLCNIEFRQLQTFAELHSIVARAIGDIPGAGELLIYDTAHRIGAFLRLEPEFVYLHAGTRVGARALGFPFQRDSLSMSELPQEFGKLRPHEVEDCLCIYKDGLKTAYRNRCSKG